MRSAVGKRRDVKRSVFKRCVLRRREQRGRIDDVEETDPTANRERSKGAVFKGLASEVQVRLGGVLSVGLFRLGFFGQLGERLFGFGAQIIERPRRAVKVELIVDAGQIGAPFRENAEIRISVNDRRLTF